MFELTDDYLEEVGIAALPEPARGNLIASVKKLIQDRVNIKIADELTDENVSELERISTSLDDAKWWLGENLSKYESSPEFTQFREQVGDEDPITLFAQSKWFQINVPNFTSVLQDTLEEVKTELKTVGGAAA